MELQRLRTRATSTLISIAMFGAFSSGKSTLVSGLQGKLEVIESVDRDGHPAEEFVGILPAAPEPANACPARVVPIAADAQVDASGRGFLRVRFTDSPDWENIGSNPIPAMVAAYLTDWAERGNRKREHWQREVAEAEILLTNHEIPAMLYDLPGYGSPNRTHDAIIKAAMNDADCFIYVTRANRTLAEEDLELIRVLYDHCRLGRKRVIWVLTGIDEAAHVDYRHIPHWRRMIERNNKYLRENFAVEGQVDSTFLGKEGFIGVSPVAEARAKARAAGDGDGGLDRRPVSLLEPGMDVLRQVIRDMVEMESGHKHVANIAIEAQGFVRPLASAVTARLRDERIPVDEQAAALAANQESLERVNTALANASKDLEKILVTRVKRASRPFGGLASHLHEQLDSAIRDTDIRNRSKANQIGVTKTQVLQAWVSATGSPGELWEQQIDKFQRDIIGWARKNVETGDTASSPHGARFDLGLLDFNITALRKGARPEVVQRAAAVVGISSSIAAAAGYFAATAGIGALFPPAAVIAGLAGAVFIGAEVFKRSRGGTSLAVMQNEWIADLDEVAKMLQGQFETSLSTHGTLMIDSMVRSLEEYRTQLDLSIAIIQKRIDDPTYQMSQGLVDQLEPPSREGQQIMDELGELIARCQQ
jgi:Dynamin family